MVCARARPVELVSAVVCRYHRKKHPVCAHAWPGILSSELLQTKGVENLTIYQHQHGWFFFLLAVVEERVENGAAECVDSQKQERRLFFH